MLNIGFIDLIFIQNFGAMVERLSKSNYIMGWYPNFRVDKRYRYFGYLPDDSWNIEQMYDDRWTYITNETFEDAVNITLDNLIGLNVNEIFVFKVVGTKVRITDIYGQPVREKLAHYKYKELRELAQSKVNKMWKSVDNKNIKGYMYLTDREVYF